MAPGFGRTEVPKDAKLCVRSSGLNHNELCILVTYKILHRALGPSTYVTARAHKSPGLRGSGKSSRGCSLCVIHIAHFTFFYVEVTWVSSPA